MTISPHSCPLISLVFLSHTHLLLLFKIFLCISKLKLFIIILLCIIAHLIHNLLPQFFQYLSSVLSLSSLFLDCINLLCSYNMKNYWRIFPFPWVILSSELSQTHLSYPRYPLSLLSSLLVCLSLLPLCLCLSVCLYLSFCFSLSLTLSFCGGTNLFFIFHCFFFYLFKSWSC